MLSIAHAKIGEYQVHRNKLPAFTDLRDEQQRKTITKITKANLKFPKRLDPGQLAELINFFTDKTLSLISITFKDFARLESIVRSFDTAAVE